MFSKSTEYALRATIYIAQKSSEENKLGIKEISEAIDSPQSFTAKILQSLTRENIVNADINTQGCADVIGLATVNHAIDGVGNNHR